MLNSTTTLNFKGITLTLQFGPWAIEKYADEMLKLLSTRPDIDMNAFGEISATAILMCGYFNYCYVNNFPRVYNWSDFYEYTKSRMATRITSEELNAIFTLFIQIQGEYLKLDNDGG